MRHLACIMDGNRRYAQAHGWKPWIGHQRGVETVRTALEFCLANKIPYLSLYTFSLENFKRSEGEKRFLFDLIGAMAQKYLAELIEKDIKVKFVGDRTLFPEHVVPTLDDVEARTAHCAALQVNFLFCYGGQQEIVYAAKEIARKVKDGLLNATDINESVLVQHMWTADTPAPELVIRSGGSQRISNFLLFQSAYSEYYFTDQFWPALTIDDFQKAFDFFNASKRNFGA
jgi:undecaprenyl diphosphate synthase